jgi:hypothetical protein
MTLVQPHQKSRYQLSLVQPKEWRWERPHVPAATRSWRPHRNDAFPRPTEKKRESSAERESELSTSVH